MSLSPDTGEPADRWITRNRDSHLQLGQQPKEKGGTRGASLLVTWDSFGSIGPSKHGQARRADSA